MSDKISVWIGITSSIITISLSVLNYNLNEKIQQTEMTIRAIETNLKLKAHELEVSKEKTARYEFINKLMPDLLKQDKNQVILTTNLIALALNEEETANLFRGFANSEQENIKTLGEIGIQGIKENRNKYKIALEHEEEAFDFMLKGEYQKAIASFESAENIYPSFHQVYEIARLLRKEKANMGNESVKEKVFKRIINDYSWKAPEKYLLKLKEFVK